MRKGLLLTLGVVAIALLPVSAFASAPIFQGVPGIINISATGDTSPTYNNVFTFDSSVYDPDTADAQIGWSFLESADTAWVQANGLTSLASAADATSPAVVGKDLRAAGAALSLVALGAAGNDASAAAAYAGTTGATYITAAAKYTTVTLYASDGFNVTQKNILVTQSAAGSDAIAGVSQQLQAPLTNGAAYVAAGWTHITVFPTFGSTQMQFNNAHANGYQATPTPTGTNLAMGWAYKPSPATFTVALGKMYRMSTTVRSTSTAATKTHEFRFRFGAVDPFNTQSAKQNLDVSTAAGSGSFFTSGAEAGGRPYQIIYNPPQNARLANTHHTTNGVEMAYDVLAWGPSAAGQDTGNDGTLIFGDTAVDELSMPARGSNGYVKMFSAKADLLAVPDGVEPLYKAGAFNAKRGWKYTALSLGGALPYLTTALHVDHGFGGTVNDAVTTCMWGTNVTSGILQVFSGVAASAYANFSLGEPDNVGNNGSSAIPIALITENADKAWYRGSITVRSTVSSADTARPGFRLRMSHPNGMYVNEFDMTAGGANRALPISTEGTTYYCWMKEVPAAWMEPTPGVFPDGNNVALNFEIVDFSNTYGGTFIIDDIAIEQFPNNFF